MVGAGTGWRPTDTNGTPPALPCDGKLAFDSHRQAAAAANVAAYQHGAAVEPYCCRHCGLWHLASV